MKKKIVYLALIVVSGFTLLSGCSKSYNAPMPMNGAMASVSIQNMAFMPDTLRITTGTTVTWTNMDGVMHTVTASSGLFDSGNLSGGQMFHYMFNTAGTFTYHSLNESSIKSGVVIVSAAGSSGY
jgi:plastocyanin